MSIKTGQQHRQADRHQKDSKALRLCVIFFCGIFVLSLITLMPARLGQVVTLPDNVTLSGWTGTVWQGKAGHVSLQNSAGEVLLEGSVAWDIQLGALLGGELCSQFYAREALLNAMPAGQNVAEVQGEACWSGGGLELQDISFALPAERLLYNTEMSMSGLIQGRLQHVKWQPASATGPASINVAGQGQWRNIELAVPGMNALRRVEWPDIPFTMSSPAPQRFQIEATFDTDSALAKQAPPDWPINALSVNLNVAMSGAYQTEILLLPDDGIDPALQSWLAVLAEEGQGDFAGGYRYFITSP